jgi:hypothetical protein
VAAAAREVAPQPAVTRLAWGLCLLAVLLAVAALSLAAFNGLNLVDLIANHHAIGIMDALVLAPIGALIVVGDRRHLLAWLLLADGLVLGALNVAEQYAPLALGLTTRRLSLPGGELASWVASWAFVPGIVIGVVFLVLLFPDGRLPSRRWWPLGLAGAVALAVPTVVLAVGTWPLRGPELVTPEGEEPDLVTAVFGITLMTTLALGAISVVALVLRFRRAGAVQRQQIKWFAYLAAPSVPLGMFAQVPPYGPYLEFLGAALQLAGLGIGIFRFRLWDIDRLINRTLVYGLLTALLGAVYARGGPRPGATVRRDRRADAELGGGRRHPGRGRPVPASPPPHPAGGGPPVQPPPSRRRRDHPDLQHPPARPARPRHALSGAAGGGRRDDAAEPGVLVATTASILDCSW